MASVQSSRASKYARSDVSEGDPVDHVQSAGELLIQQLVHKQTNTQVTLDQQLREEKKFQRGIGYVSLNELGAGASSLQQFEDRKRQAERVEELLIKGLNRQEALSLIKNVRKSKATTEAQEILHQRLIQEPMQQSDYPVNEHIQFMKRQEHELALSVKPESVETRLYQFAVNNESTQKLLQCNSQPPDHPIHQLAAMERSLMSTADPQITARTLRRKRRQQVEAMAEPLQVHNKPPDRHQSLWDATERPILMHKPSHILERKITCHRKTLYTIRKGEIIKLQNNDLEKDNDSTLPSSKPSGNAYVSLQKAYDCPDICGKLSEEEIKELPRFKNYNRGKESKTLYIKNISPYVTESDLAAIFDQFQESCDGQIIFRLMLGKMRGQAFVTFKCSKNATNALQCLNGAILKGKPIIIQYGKQED